MLLDQNYRSTQTILDAANAVIANNVGRKPKHLWTEQVGGELITRYHAEDEHDEAQFVRRTRSTRLDRHRATRCGDVAVFYRTNAQSRVIEETLVRAASPYRVVGGTQFYDRREVKDALAYLRALVNPDDEVSWKRIVNAPKRGVGDTSVGKVEAYASGARPHVPRRAARGPTPPASPAGRSAASTTCSSCWTTSSDARPPTARRPWSRRSCDRTGYLAELEAERIDRGRGPHREPGRAASASARDVRARVDAFLEQISLVADTDELDDDDHRGRAHDAPLGQGPRVPGRVPHRARGRRLPAPPLASASPTSSRRSGASATWASPVPASGCTSPTRGAARCSARPTTTRRAASSTRSPRSSCRVEGNRRASRRAAGSYGSGYGGGSSGGGYGTPRGRTPGSYGGGEGWGTRRRRSEDDEWSGPVIGGGGRDQHREDVIEAALAPTRPAPSGADALGLKVGDDVHHGKFGDGVITAIEGSGDKAEAVVHFAGVGEKRLLLAWAPLQKR